MIFVDTSFLIALAEPRDSLHLRAKKWIASKQRTFLVSEYVIVELVNYFSRSSLTRSMAHLIVEEVQTDSRYHFIPPSAGLFSRGLQLHRSRPDKQWSLTDCISFVLMREYDVTAALTHDIHFEQAGFEALLRREPPQG